ncbi:hypothetical protein SI65_09600 [Aspergillus cristatus]|uniref:Uncharacterized protein n=1 Tax=Aspergillus cristatus TaxID=573508 RepID=A0A1E3B1R1_ASPCR|nr:hypothetical protein SI65_09600 [Aspergillus cristatus]
MNLDFRLAKASDFLGIQQISKHSLRNTVTVLAHDIPSTVQTLQDNMPFPNEDDNTAAYPTYLSVPVLVARNTTSASGENKPRVVGYAFLGPRRKSTSTTGDAWTMEVRKLAVGGGKWYIFPVEGMAGTNVVRIDTAYLWFDGPGDAGDGGDSSSDNFSGHGGGDGDGEGSEAGSVESEGSAGSEGSAASYDSYGSEGSQGSRTSVSSERNGHESDDDEDEDNEHEEDDWDDDDDPYGEVEDDDIEFD